MNAEAETAMRLNAALYSLMHHHIARYLMANTAGRECGWEKAEARQAVLYLCRKPDGLE